MTRINTALTILLLATLWSTGRIGIVGAQSAPLTIASVQADLVNGKLVISGVNFGASIGSVTFALVGLNIDSWTATEIVASGLPTSNDGTYLLTVSTGASADENDRFYVSFGAAGPQGPTGADGPAGPIGLTGPEGPTGPTGVPTSDATDYYIGADQNGDDEFSRLLLGVDGKTVMTLNEKGNVSIGGASSARSAHERTLTITAAPVTGLPAEDNVAALELEGAVSTPYSSFATIHGFNGAVPVPDGNHAGNLAQITFATGSVGPPSGRISFDITNAQGEMQSAMVASELWQLLVRDGSTNRPSYSSVNYPTSGMYFGPGPSVGLSANGQAGILLTGDKLTSEVALSVGGASLDIGSSNATKQIQFRSSGGSTRAKIAADVSRTGDLHLISDGASPIVLGSNATTWYSFSEAGFLPQVDNTRDVGSSSKRMRAGYFGGSLASSSLTTGDVSASLLSANSYVAIGSSAAASGELRLGNGARIMSRDIGSTNDRTILTFDTDNRVVLGNLVRPAVMRSNLATPTGLTQGEWWVDCAGTSPARTCALKVRDGGANRTIASFTY